MFRKLAESLRTEIIVVAAFSVAATIFAALNPMLATDTACRYAPMAEAFAAGNWVDAFHPRFGVGASVFSGLFVLVFRMDGYAACAATSTLVWSLAALPVFWIARRVFDVRTAWFAMIAYLICPQPFVWALKGLREPYKMLGVFLALHALMVWRQGGWKAVLEAAVALLLLFCFKCDAIAIGALALVAFVVLDCFGRRGWALVGFSILALQPMCFIVWKYTHWWLPAPQYYQILSKYFGA